MLARLPGISGVLGQREMKEEHHVVPGALAGSPHPTNADSSPVRVSEPQGAATEGIRPFSVLRPPLPIVPRYSGGGFVGNSTFHPDTVRRDAGRYLQDISGCIHHDQLRYGVVRLLVLGEGQVDSCFDDPVEHPLVVVGEEHNRQDELPVTSAQPDSLVRGMRRIDVGAGVRAVRRVRMSILLVAESARPDSSSY